MWLVNVYISRCLSMILAGYGQPFEKWVSFKVCRIKSLVVGDMQ